MCNLKRLFRLFAASLTLAAVFTGSAGAQAQIQGQPLERTYRVIVPQKVDSGERIEVIDFFWYG